MRGIFGVILSVLVFNCSARPAPESCGLGLPPDAPGYAEAEARADAEVRREGFLRVCDANLERYNIVFGPIASAKFGLAFEPVDLSHTAFSQLRDLGGNAEAIGDIKSRLYRGFRLPGGQTLTLFEHDMSADGSRSGRNPKDEPERINGLPARLVVLQAPSGRAVSNISWLEGRRFYELWIDANVARHPMRATLFALAASLPASIPGCPNEPKPEPFLLGPDGVPIPRKMPAVLTEAQAKALFDDSKRPCK